MKRIENFIFNDIVLYSKGWFCSKENVTWKDLAHFFGEIYAYKPRTEEEVSLMMMLVLEKIYKELDLSRNPEQVCGKWHASPYSLELEIRNKMQLFNCNRDKAIIIVVMSILMSMSKDEIKLKKPFYSKKNPFRIGGFFESKKRMSMTYAEMNRIASKHFDE